MNKKLIYLVAFSILVVLLVGGLFFYSKNKTFQSQQENQIQNQNVINQKVNNQSESKLEEQNLIQEDTKISTQTEEKFYTIEEISQHNSKENCWAVIRGDVYDLTKWIDKHPGGEDKILSICGKDGTQAFERKHGGQEKPEKALEKFKIGRLKQ
ncbi:MAG: hypothetical protein KatS3mg095_0913 [Candidatus Parcubacteria bacterium]|nr:MAG: hypothetical protein KatS3mg095_0913 [Candidatus Parcubacteria bacterium]